MKHIEVNCDSLAECYSRIRRLINISDLCHKASVTLDIDLDSAYDSSYILVPTTESKSELLIEKIKEMRHAQMEFERTRITGWNYEIQRLGQEIDELLPNK